GTPACRDQHLPVEPAARSAAPQRGPVQSVTREQYLKLFSNGHTITSEGRDIQMKLSVAVWILAAIGFAAHAQTAMPRMASCEPPNGKIGDVIVVSGENLQKENVAKVYLTDGANDTLVEVTEQTASSIKFKIPAKIKPGRLALAVLTTGKEQRLIEMP